MYSLHYKLSSVKLAVDVSQSYLQFLFWQQNSTLLNMTTILSQKPITQMSRIFGTAPPRQDVTI